MSNTQSTIEAVKAIPATTSAGLILAGVPLDQWVLIGSATLITLQIFFLLRDKVYRPWKERNAVRST